MLDGHDLVVQYTALRRITHAVLDFRDQNQSLSRKEWILNTVTASQTVTKTQWKERMHIICPAISTRVGVRVKSK
jgi:hypothetical protein